MVRGEIDVVNVRPKFGFSGPLIGFAKLVWLNALKNSPRSSVRYRSAKVVVLAMDRSMACRLLPGMKFIPAFPKRGVCAGCLAVLSGQSNAFRSNFGVVSPSPPRMYGPSRSGRQMFIGEELQLASAMVGP